MKKILIVLTACLILGVTVFADESYVVRSVNWGMTKDEVTASEGKQPDKTKGQTITYSNQMLNDNLHCQISYTFKDEKLVMAQYHTFWAKTSSGEFWKMGFAPEEDRNTTTDEIDIRPYDTLLQLLTTKYGQTEQIETWTNETYRNQASSIGYHVKTGHLSLSDTWITDKAVICLTATKGNLTFHIYTNLTYYDPDYYQSLQVQKPAATDIKGL